MRSLQRAWHWWGAQIPGKSLPDSCLIFPRAGKHPSLDAFNEGMLAVIFVFARRYFVSLLFLLLAEVVFFFCEVITKLILATCAWLGLEHTMGKKSYPSTFLNFSTFVLRITWNLTPPFSPLSIPKHHERHAARDPRHFSCECFFCVNDYVIMKTEIGIE